MPAATSNSKRFLLSSFAMRMMSVTFIRGFCEECAHELVQIQESVFVVVATPILSGDGSPQQA